MDSIERYRLAESLGYRPSEASARTLIAMLADNEPFMISEGFSVYDVEPTWGRVSAVAHSSLVRMLPFAAPIIIEALLSATVESTRELLSVLDSLPVEQRVALSDEALAAIERATKKLDPEGAEGARFERDFARRVRANELTTTEAFWRAWLAHPTRAFHAIDKLADIVEERGALARELAAWWLEHPGLGRYAVCGVLERSPGVLPAATVRALAASQLPRENEQLVPVLAAYGEPAAELIPQCLEMLRNEPLAEDETWPPRHVRWRRATTALVQLIDAFDPRTIEALEPMLVEMAASPDHHYRGCGTQIRDALVERRVELTETAVKWKHTGGAEFPYTAEVRGRRLTIRINDFPAEPMYTLLSDGVELQDLEDWPPPWVRPSPPKQLLDVLNPRPKRPAR